MIEQWARYLRVVGSIPAQLQIFINFQISLASELPMKVNMCFLLKFEFFRHATIDLKRLSQNVQNIEVDIVGQAIL